MSNNEEKLNELRGHVLEEEFKKPDREEREFDEQLDMEADAILAQPDRSDYPVVMGSKKGGSRIVKGAIAVAVVAGLGYWGVTTFGKHDGAKKTDDQVCRTQCNDGTCSPSVGPGTCSYHGGIKRDDAK